MSKPRTAKFDPKIPILEMNTRGPVFAFDNGRAHEPVVDRELSIVFGKKKPDSLAEAHPKTRRFEQSEAHLHVAVS